MGAPIERPFPSAGAATTIRPALGEDCPRLARLSTELGYPMTPEEARQRLAPISDHPDHALLVALHEGSPAGWIQVTLPRIFEAPLQAEIAGLVVDETRRERGIGRMLVEAAEAWARLKGCGAVRVRSNVVRAQAHAFYRRSGYREIKSQRVFEKAL